MIKALSKRGLCTLDTLQEHQNILKNATISRNSDIENALGQWKKNILKHPAYFSEDIWDIYIYINVIKYGDPTYVEKFMDPIRMIQIFLVFHQLLILSPT